jgi:hypothetical protein
MANNTFRQKRGAKKRNQTKKRNQVKKMRAKKMQRGGEPHKIYKMYYAVNQDNTEAKKIMYVNDKFIGGADNITLEDFHTFLLDEGFTFIAIYIKTDLTNIDNQIMFDEVERHILTQISSGSTVDPLYDGIFFKTGTDDVGKPFGLLPAGNSVPFIVEKHNGSIILVTKKVPSYKKGELESKEKIVDIVPMVIGFDVPPPSSQTLNFERMDAKLRLNRQEEERKKEAQIQLQEQERQQYRQQQEEQKEAQREEEEKCILQRKAKYDFFKEQHTWDTLNNSAFIRNIKDRKEDPCENKESDWGMPFYNNDVNDDRRLKIDNILRENAMTESASELQQPPENTLPVTPPPKSYYDKLSYYLPNFLRGSTTTRPPPPTESTVFSGLITANTKILPKHQEARQQIPTMEQKVEEKRKEKRKEKRNNLLAYRASFLEPNEQRIMYPPSK